MDRGFELLEKLTVVQWLLQRTRQRARAESGPVVDPTCGQGRILALLKLKDDVSTKDLSMVLGIRVSSLNEMLAKLEKNGYVERHPSEDDKRVMLVTLTEKGRDANQEEDGPASLFSCLSTEEQEQLGDYLDRIIAALEDAMGEDGRATLEFAPSPRRPVRAPARRSDMTRASEPRAVRHVELMCEADSHQMQAARLINPAFRIADRNDIDTLCALRCAQSLEYWGMDSSFDSHAFRTATEAYLEENLGTRILFGMIEQGSEVVSISGLEMNDRLPAIGGQGGGGFYAERGATIVSCAEGASGARLHGPDARYLDVAGHAVQRGRALPGKPQPLDAAHGRKRRVSPGVKQVQALAGRRYLLCANTRNLGANRTRRPILSCSCASPRARWTCTSWAARHATARRRAAHADGSNGISAASTAAKRTSAAANSAWASSSRSYLCALQ